MQISNADLYRLTTIVQAISHEQDGSVFVKPGLPRDDFFYLVGDAPPNYPMPATLANVLFARVYQADVVEWTMLQIRSDLQT